MTGRVRTSGRSRWSRSVAEPDDERGEPGAEDDDRERVAPEPGHEQPERERPDDRDDHRPPVDRAAGRVLLVMFRPACREPVRRDAECGAARAEQPGDRLHGEGACRSGCGGSAGRRAGERELDQRGV